MVYSNCKIYGPYSRKDGRKHIIILYPDKKRKTVSYPKYLMEKHLGRYLEENETVDHMERLIMTLEMDTSGFASEKARPNKSLYSFFFVITYYLN